MRLSCHQFVSNLAMSDSTTMELQLGAEATVWYRDLVITATMGPVASFTDCSIPTNLARSLTLILFLAKISTATDLIFSILSCGMLKVRSRLSISSPRNRQSCAGSPDLLLGLNTQPQSWNSLITWRSATRHFSSDSATARLSSGKSGIRVRKTWPATQQNNHLYR